jgi:hypothetical protein
MMEALVCHPLGKSSAPVMSRVGARSLIWELQTQLKSECSFQDERARQEYVYFLTVRNHSSLNMDHNTYWTFG